MTTLFVIPVEQSDMSAFDENATIVVTDRIIHFSSAVPEFFAVEKKTTVRYEMSETPGVGRTYSSSVMDEVRPAEQIVRFMTTDPDSGQPAWVRAVVNGLRCYVRISPNYPNLVEFMRLSADDCMFGW